MSLFPPPLRFACICLLLLVVLPLYMAHTLAGLSGLISTAVGLLTALVWYGEYPCRAYPNIPGPPSKWLIGNLDMFRQLGGYHKAYEKVTQDYGRVARIQMGHWTQIVLQDPALIKEIGVEKFDLFRDRLIPFSLRANKGLLTAKGDEWHRSRRALNPAFNSIKLAAFANTISRHCQALTNRLDRIILEGHHEDKPIDVVQLFGDLTMDVIGSTSFDAEFGLQESPLEGLEEATKKNPQQQQPQQQQPQQGSVVEAAKNIFMSSGGIMGFGGTVTQFVTVVAPILGPLLKLAFPLLLTPETIQLVRSVRKLERILSEILEGRSQFSQTNNNNDENNDNHDDTTVTPKASVDANFIDLVRKAQDPVSGIGLDNDEVRDQLGLFILAGYETTANTLSYTAFLLAQHPQVEAKLVEEIQRLAPNKDTTLNFKDLAEFKYTSNVINEALRLYPPGAMLRREAQQDVVLGNGKYPIQKGTWMIIPVYSLHRDELYWEKPEEFNPDRFADSTKLTKYAHLPFGVGPRNCIGQRFALEEIKLALIAIYREHTFKLHAKTELPLQLRAGITLSPAHGIWMTVHRREASQ